MMQQPMPQNPYTYQTPQMQDGSDFSNFDFTNPFPADQTYNDPSAFDGNNFTYNTDVGGFGDDNRMSLDPRGFKHIIQAEAEQFLHPHQLMLNATVTDIRYRDNGPKEGVAVRLADGSTLEADYAICTFSLGVLQHDDVVFDPPLPDWKQEAIQSMTMVRPCPALIYDILLACELA